VQNRVSTQEFQCNTVPVLKSTNAEEYQYITVHVQYNISIVEDCKFSISVVEYQKRTVPLQYNSSVVDYQ